MVEIKQMKEDEEIKDDEEYIVFTLNSAVSGRNV